MDVQEWAEEEDQVHVGCWVQAILDIVLLKLVGHDLLQGGDGRQNCLDEGQVSKPHLGLPMRASSNLIPLHKLYLAFGYISTALPMHLNLNF